VLELVLCLVGMGEVEGGGNGHYIPRGLPVRFDSSVSLPIEGVGSLVGGSVCVPEAAHLAIGLKGECFLSMGK